MTWFGQSILKSLTLIDVDGSFSFTPEYQIAAMKMAILIDRNRPDTYYKAGRPRTWEEWRTLVRNSNFDLAENDNLTHWFPTDEVADEWLTHTLRHGSRLKNLTE